MGLGRIEAASTVHLSPCGRGVGRLRRPFLRTPKRSFGYVASLDAIRVRGFSPSGKLFLAPADADPSSVADFVRATFSHKGRRKGVALHSVRDTRE
jgi:hypothetical protein